MRHNFYSPHIVDNVQKKHETIDYALIIGKKTPTNANLTCHFQICPSIPTQQIFLVIHLGRQAEPDVWTNYRVFIHDKQGGSNFENHCSYGGKLINRKLHR